MRVLLISYFFEPYPGVGAARTTYWAKNMSKLGVEVHVVTATPQEEMASHITYLPSGKNKGLLGKVIKDQGLHWKENLKEYFQKMDRFDYDVVLFSGGPFMHFGVGSYLQKRFKCKVVLDYRDPFGYNPRHNDSWLKKNVKSFFERRFNRMADAITTVNEICKADMSYSEKVKVIPNGFDDKILESQKTAVEIVKGRLLNGGKLYTDFNLSPFLAVLDQNETLSLRQIGQKSDLIDAQNNPRLTSQGFVAYEELLNQIATAEICLVLTGGKSFETPTKTYDYIGLNKKILVITEGETHTGGIQSILQDYPNAAWAENNPEAIKNAIAVLQNKVIEKIDSHVYSRRYGLEKLIDFLRNLKAN